jgi:branched-chain amino acid transport system substrate-binding protein
MKKRIISISCFLIFVALISTECFAKNGIDVKNKTISIAGYDACTGKYGDYGLDDKKGQEIAIEEINAGGGVQAGPLKGYQLKLTFFDDRGDPKESANVAKKIASSDFLAALGPTMSSCALAATPIFNRYEIADIITYSNANTITEQGFNNIIRLTHTTGGIASHMAENCKNRFNAKSVSIISENQDYGQQLRSYFKGKADEMGLKVLTDDVITPGQDVDFSSVLIRAKQKNPDVLVLFVTYNEGGMLAKQVHKMGWKVTVYGPDGIIAPKFFELADNLDDIYITSLASLDMNRPEARHLVETYQTKYGILPPLSAIYGYDAVKVAVKIIENGGVDRKSFIKKLKSVKVAGVGSPMYQFDEKGEGLAPPFITNPAQWYKEQK